MSVREGIPTDLRPLDPTGIRRTRDGWIDSTEEQGTTKQGETDCYDPPAIR